MAQPEQIPPEDLIELPLFPLNVVLFPGMQLPLHIFEERYKAMIGDCLEREEPFGIVLIKEGPEVGGPAEPFRVGTSARILKADHLEEGRMNILTRGDRRFQVVEITQQVPHMVGQVRYLEEEEGEDPSEAAAQVGESFEVFLRGLAALAGGWTAHALMPQDPVGLSYRVASSIDLPGPVRQQLLDAATARERLEQILPLLNRSNEALQQEIVKRTPFQGHRLN